ncbi:MAG: family 20 glycosylhydrolase, partial [Leadbetterella sp.]|nr:family 20 glycosylhydrolase [Leadbetterella sp.]
EKVKQILNWMAFYKLNRFHWHLTDEPAWRLEIRKYPLLSLVGGIGNYTDPTAEAKYYTQQDIRDIVAYAARRQIEIIPEIDMPGHATAANRAYPQFSGGGSKNHPDFTFHPAKKGTYTYLTHVLKEVNVLFPSGMVHLGGDEVSFGSEAWNHDRLIDSLKAQQKLTTNREVETYFMRRMADSLFHMNARMGVWDEMADSGLPKDKTIQFWWRHDKPGQLQLALKNGYAAVVCPRIPFYFDFVQEEKHRYGRKWGGAFGSLNDLYAYKIEELRKTETYKGQILGVQGNLWTETVNTPDRLDYLTFPRLAALAEVGWSSSEVKNYSRFLEQLKKHLNLYKAENLYFYDPFDPAREEAYFNKPPQKYLDNPED